MTLEKGKHYGTEQIQQTLQDKARTRLNNPTPHQAPQRERVSRSAVPGHRSSPSGQRRGGGGSGGGGGGRHWKQLIRPDVNLGVPQLMMILEPNVVWEHTQAYVNAVGKDVEASVTPGEFFEGWHKGGRKAHGCYEGSYWELIGDCDELAEMLRKMAKAPALLEEPPLELPPPPELPRWEDFKPSLNHIPAAPALPPLKLPPFRAPILESEVPFLEPEYIPVPTVPQQPREEPLPSFLPPEFLALEPLQEPGYVDPPPPVLAEAPRPPAFGQPKHGHDWTGERPFQLDLPDRAAFLREAAKAAVMDTSRWAHPPGQLPMLPELEPMDADLLAGLEMEPIPKLELAWMGGPEPDPPYASVPSTPAALSRHSSRAPSRAPSRPVSALPLARPGSSLAQPSSSPAVSRPRSAAAPPAASHGTATAAAVPSLPLGASLPTVDASSPDLLSSAASSPSLTPPLSARRGSAAAAAAAAAGVAASASRTSLATPRTPEEAAWDDARSIASEASGAPRMWVNFAPPFADLPPIMLPPQPEPGAEPAPEDFPHEELEELPAFTAPTPAQLPVYVEPPAPVPSWSSPCEPRPVGFLRGTAPVVICDVSGTMHPRQQGQFRSMKKCAIDLLDPEGELATAAFGFDVITFCSTAWSWATGYGERMGLLQSSQVLYSGRQVGGKHSSKTPPRQGGSPRSQSPDRSGSPSRHPSPSRFGPGAGGGGANESSGGGGGGGGGGSRGLTLQPTTPDLLSDAQRWVSNWPDAVGQTKLMTAFKLAEQHAGADCWYVLSDGMAHDQQACVEFLTTRAANGLPLPVIHAVGFIAADASPDCAGERFLRGLAEMTGGSYQRYSPEVVKVWQPAKGDAKGGFVPLNVRSESPDALGERRWAEQQLRAERRKNLRLGIVEPIEVTMERVSALHHQMRVLPALRANAAASAEAQRRHLAACEAVRGANAEAAEAAAADHEAATEAARGRNQGRVDAARQAFLESHSDWERDYLDRLQEWEDAKVMLERQREEQLAATRTASPPRGPSARGASSRPTSASAFSAATSRPKSAAAMPFLSPRLVSSDARAWAAAGEYDAVHGLDRHADKLSPSPTPPGSRPGSAAAAAAAASASPSRGGSGGGSGGGARPRSAKPPAAGAAADDYLESIAEDLAEASAPLDSIFTGTTPRGVPSRSRSGLGLRSSTAVDADPDADALDDDGLDVVPPSARRGGGAAGGSDSSGRERDQNSGGGRGGGSGRRSSGAERPLSGRASGGVDRPISARVSGGGSGADRPMSGHRSSSGAVGGGGRPPSARLGSGVSRGLLPEGSALPPPLPEPSALLVPLPGEKSDEFKRRILPPEVVEDLDAANAARLDEIRGAWEALLAADAEAGESARLAVLQRNAILVEAYRQAVYGAYADSLIKDVVYGGAVRQAANLALKDGADARYQAELARVMEENARLRELHAAEVEERRAKEEVHAQAHARWQDHQDAAMAAHEADRQRARREHEANLERLRAQWAAKKQEVDDLNAARLAEAEAMHEALVERTKEANRAHKAEHTELLRQRKEVETTNLSRLAEAKVAHKVRLEARAADNERTVKQAMADHQAACVRMSEEYEEARVAAEAEHAELCTFLRSANEQLTEEARRRYTEAIAEVQAAHEAECAALREQHTRDMERVHNYNVEIWPKVHVARLALAELGRVQAFAEHIRFCANKFEMGVNLVPNTPNYDRVVEMQALTDALDRAFPDLTRSTLPWPDHERRQEPGTGWVAAPTPRPLTYRDPADIITKIALGRVTANGSPAPSPRNTSPRTRTGAAAEAQAQTQGPQPGTAADEQMAFLQQQYGQRTMARPLSAGRARFANVLSAEGGGSSQRPFSALPAGSAAAAAASGRMEAWGNVPSAHSSPGLQRPMSAAHGVGAGPGPGAGNAVGYHNPSAWRRSATTAGLLHASSPRGAAGSASAAVAALAAAAAATAAAGGGGRQRPGTARAYSPYQSASPQYRSQQQQESMQSGGPSRPRSAGPPPRPARVAVDVWPLQASVARSKAQAGAHVMPPATMAGFAKDVPKLRYPEVDVQQALTVTR